MMTGRIHSVQSLGAVDGPGLRYVVFMQGCPLRCVYCHNPDTWNPDGGTEINTSTLVKKIMRYQPYFQKNGGVTVSGGEPLLQWEFVAELFRDLRMQGIHTALDTSGIASKEAAEAVLKHTDLVLADLKFTTDAEYLRYTGGTLHTVQRFLEQTAQMQIPLWIRHVVVPRINDNLNDMCRVRKIARQYPNLKKIEWLPFHNLCKEKYETMGISFPLADTEAMEQQRLDELLQELPKSCL